MFCQPKRIVCKSLIAKCGSGKLVKVFLLLLFLQLKQVQAQQKENNHTFYVTAGAVSTNYLRSIAVNSLFAPLFSALFGTTPKALHGSQPVICVGYQYEITRNVKAGIEGIRDRFWINSKDEQHTYYSLLIRSDYIWLNTERVELYSGLGAGISFAKSKSNYTNTFKEEKNTLLGWQVYTIGLDYKLKSFTLTANTGFGTLALVNGGVKYTF